MKRKKSKKRSGVILDMFLRHKNGGPMKDRRTPRKGSKNSNKEYQDSVIDEY